MERSFSTIAARAGGYGATTAVSPVTTAVAPGSTTTAPVATAVVQGPPLVEEVMVQAPAVAVPQVEVREVIQEVPQVVAVEVARQGPNVEYREVVKNLPKPVQPGLRKDRRRATNLVAGNCRGGATGAECGADPPSAQAPHPESTEADCATSQSGL